MKTPIGPSVTATIALPPEAFTVVAAPPELLSQRNVEPVTSIPARVFLELTRAPDFPLRVAKIGKLRLVDRAAFVAWVREQGTSATSTPANDSPPLASAGPPTTAEGVLEELGVTVRPRAAGRARR